MKKKIEKQRKMILLKRKIQDTYFKVMGYIIGKPYLFFEKQINEFTKRKMNNYIPKYQEKVVKELVKYIQYRLSRYSYPTTISISSVSTWYDDYTTDIRVDRFVGYGFSPSKHNKLAKMFYTYVIRNSGKQNEFFEEILQSVLSYLSAYDEISVEKLTRNTKEFWEIKYKG